MMRTLPPLAAIAAMLLPTNLLADTSEKVVVLELFTAEGCSSCPPADALAVQLDAAQLTPGTRIVVLSEHVDYWNRDWPDPHSSAQLTARQDSYIHARGQRNPYTPQLIVDGTSEIRLRDRQEIAQVLQTAAIAAKIPVHISALSLEAGSHGNVRGRVEVDGQSQHDAANVYLAVALNHVESKVLRGENGGRTLTHVGVVDTLVKIGTLTPGRAFAQDFNLPSRTALDQTNTRIVAFVQEAGVGKIVGAASATP